MDRLGRPGYPDEDDRDEASECRICSKETFGFDEHGPLCIDCAVVLALKGEL